MEDAFTDYGIHGFTMAHKDPRSTFALDVDTASYTIGRRTLNEDKLPPIASVRVEEYVNFFQYDYPKPEAPYPFAVAFEAFPDPFRAGRHIMRVGLRGRGQSEDRPTLHLTFLVDVSGSMANNDRLGLVKTSLYTLLEQLQPGDTVALATYAGHVSEVLPPTPATRKQTMSDAIEALSAEGSTAMSSGIDLAYTLAERAFEAGAENRVIILSDGDANVGETSWEKMLSQIKSHADKGVTLSTVGFGMGNYRDTLMEQLADHGDGNNFYVDTAAQSRRVFETDFLSNVVTLARDVKLQVAFNPASVIAYRLIGYENRDLADEDFRDDRVDAGEVGLDHTVTALYEVILTEHFEEALATVHLRYEAPGADSDAQEMIVPFPAHALREMEALTSQDARIAYAAATFAEKLRKSPHVEELLMDTLIAYTQRAERGTADDAEMVQLMKTARRLGIDNGYHHRLAR